MNRMKAFEPQHPTGDTPGIEPVQYDVLKAAVTGVAPQPAGPAPAPRVELTQKSLRLPSDVVDFIDYTYTKDKKMRKQDAYAQAIEAFFRPLMLKHHQRG